MTAAGVHDDAGPFPGVDESFAGIGAVELQNQIIHVAHEFHERRRVGFHFFQERALVHDLAAWRIHHFAEVSADCWNLSGDFLAVDGDCLNVNPAANAVASPRGFRYGLSVANKHSNAQAAQEERS